jgi:cytidyltransferase-like protein
MKVVLVTGGFDPLHSGHIAYFKAAREIGDHLVVGLNSDAWLTRKKGRPFMPWEERAAIIKELSCVDEVIEFEDDDQGSACGAIAKILSTKGNGWKIILANGGDRNISNIPEYTAYKNHPDVGFAWGIGGEDKKNSSSWILTEWKAPKTERQWGYYRVLYEVPGVKVKELTVLPGKSLSMQRHKFRNEFWMVSEGECIVKGEADGVIFKDKYLSIHNRFDVPTYFWHQLTNPYDKPCKIVEIQYGNKCEEDDIERK